MRYFYTLCAFCLLAFPARAQTFSTFGATLSFPADVAVGGPLGRTYVSEFGTNRINILDAAGTSVGTITLPGGPTPYGQEFSSAGDLYVVALNNSVYRVTNLSTTPTVALFATPGGAGSLIDLAFGPAPVGAVCTPFADGTVLYVTRNAGNTTSSVRYLNSNGTECGSIAAAGVNLTRPGFVAYSATRNSLLVTEGSNGRITEVALATGALTTFYSTGSTNTLNDIVLSAPPTGDALCTNTFGGRVAYVADETLNAVRLIDAAGVNCRTLTSAAFASPSGLAFRPDGTLYVSNATPSGQLARSVSPLPVELVAFTATVDGPRVRLRWTTASETNNAGFAVEARRDGGAFETVGTQPGRGTSTEAADYAFTTAPLAPGRYAFRLRQVDLDGTVAYSAETSVEVGLGGAYAFAAPAPNPAAGLARTTLSVRETQAVRVEVTDVLGRRVALLHDGRVEAGQSLAVTVETASLPAGLYLLRAAGERFQATRTLTVVR